MKLLFFKKLFKHKNSIFTKALVIAILFSVFVFVSAYSYASTVSSSIADSVFRLHIIANSDSTEDQSLKYIVRDNLISYMNSICSDSNTKSEIIKIANSHKSDFYKIAKQTIIDEGFDYEVTISIGNFYFPTKSYGDISLPSGLYDALEVKIGKAEGHNWWCVMFPPLCFVDITSGVVPTSSKDSLKDNLSDEEYNLISNTDDNSEISFKFKIIEFFENLQKES